jgi:hypothetical protein
MCHGAAFVSTRVGNVKNNDPNLTEPIAAA